MVDEASAFLGGNEDDAGEEGRFHNDVAVRIPQLEPPVTQPLHFDRQAELVAVVVPSGVAEGETFIVEVEEAGTEDRRSRLPARRRLRVVCPQGAQPGTPITVGLNPEVPEFPYYSGCCYYYEPRDTRFCVCARRRSLQPGKRAVPNLATAGGQLVCAGCVTLFVLVVLIVVVGSVMW